ncbi:MAG TPA: hypothetical protein VFQ96_05930 [Microbacteriaceae bacterium]|nr:hypothetical protein [Microbacteriaceae bacterium]
MQWLSDFTAWLTSDDTQPVVFTAIVLALAVIVAGLLAAWISRGALQSVLTRTERQQKASAITAIVDAATEASVWNSLTPQEQILSDRAVGQADTLIRLMPVRGSGTAANWAAHQLAEMKRHSATYSYQLDPAVAELRDRLIEWQYHPRRIHKTFQEDLDRWSFEYQAEKEDREAARRQNDPAANTSRPDPAGPAAEGLRAEDLEDDEALTKTVATPTTPGAPEAARQADGETAPASELVVDQNPGMLPTGPGAD